MMFRGNTQLEAVNIPASVKTIGWNAFDKCKKITSISLPDGITAIRSQAFSETGIKQIQWPAAVTAIEAGMFFKSALESIVIPEGVTVIYAGAFRECANLTSVTLPSTIKTIGEVGAYGSTMAGAVVSAIGQNGGDAFRKCKNLTTLVIPDSVKTINFVGYSSFAEIKLPLATQARLRDLGYKETITD